MITIIVLVVGLATGAFGQPNNCQLLPDDPSTDCSVTCGTGTNTVQYTVFMREEPGGINCTAAAFSANIQTPGLVLAVDDQGGPKITVTKSCNRAACESGCVYSEFVPGPCSTTCGEGSRVSTRTGTPPLIGGGTCTDTTKTDPCNEGPCPCVYQGYTDVGSCSTTCGDGQQQRTVNIIDVGDVGGTPCPPDDSVPCNEGPCPCVYQGYTDVGSCSTTCGDGQQQRTVNIIDPGDVGGTPCPPDDSVPCNEGPCQKPCYKCYDEECKKNQDIDIAATCPEHQFEDIDDCRKECVACKANDLIDLTFVLDSSGSINNADFLKSVQFVMQVVNVLPQNSRLGVITFDTNPLVRLTFDESAGKTTPQLQALVMAINRVMSGVTATYKALDLARTTFIEGTMNRPNARDIVITLTDGGSFNPPKTDAQAAAATLAAANALRAAGGADITTFAIGVGNGIDVSELVGIAGDPSRAFSVDDFDALNDALIKEIGLVNVCEPNKKDKVIFGSYLYPHYQHGWYSPFKHSGAIFNYPREIGPHGAGAGNHLLQREIDRTKISHTQRQQFCGFPLAAGHGHQTLARYFYNPYLGICQLFTYTGEGGNPNNFIAKNHCDDACGRLADEGVAPPASPFYFKYGGFHNLL